MFTPDTLLEARLAVSMPAFSLQPGSEIPSDIQWMPPGDHAIVARKGATRELIEKKVRVDAAVAQRLQTLVQERRNAAASGLGDLPYLDFNHEDAEASARILAIEWGGDDPRTGGIRAKVEWTTPGQAALEGKAYRRFSPSFYVDAEGRVTGAPVNMGGLVNQAAFKTIQPIVAGAADAASDASAKRMETEKLAAELAAAKQTITELQAKLANSASESVIKAKDDEITTLKTELATIQTKLKDQAILHAKMLVDTAVKDGRLAPQATELQAKWVTTLANDPSSVDMLNAMPRVTVAGQMVHGKAGGAQQGAVAKTAEAFVELVNAKQGAGKTKAQAIDAAISESPEAYASWREQGDGRL